MPNAVRERRRAATEADVLAAAWDLAEEHGIAALTLRDLARAVGMRAPSLYTYFPSKGAIYDAMFAEGYRALGETLAELVLDPEDLAGSLAAAFERFVEFGQRSVPRYQLMFTSAVPGWQPSAAAYAVSVEQYATTAGRLSRVGITDQRDLDLLLALMSGLAAQQLANEPAGDRWRSLSREAAEMVLAHVHRRSR